MFSDQPKALTTTFGFSSKTRSSAIAGPLGVLRPCSQFCTVSTLTPIILANCDCDTLTDFLSLRISTALYLKAREAFARPLRILPASLILLLRSSNNLRFMTIPLYIQYTSLAYHWLRKLCLFVKKIAHFLHKIAISIFIAAYLLL